MPSKVCAVFAAFGLAFAFPFPDGAQQTKPEDTIEICGVVLRIGLQQGRTLESLSKQCIHNSTSDDGKGWIIATKDTPRQYVGDVHFESDRLQWVSKSWRNQAVTAVEFGDAIYFAAAHFVAESRTRCTLDATQTETPDSRLNKTWVTCGRKELLIVVHRAKGFADSMDVKEILR